MNNTQAQMVELAERMLKGELPVEEVALMTGLPIEQIEKMKETVVPNHGKPLDNFDFSSVGPVMYDNNIIDEEIDQDY